MKTICSRLFLLTLSLLPCLLTAQVIPTNRLVDWSGSGYHGSIDPSATWIDVTQYGVTGDAVTDNTVALRSLITAAGGLRTVLYFPPGDYLFRSTITLRDSIVLRGASSDSTHFLFNFSGASGYCITANGSGNSAWKPVTGGYFKDNRWITVADSGLIQPGDWMEIRQANGSWDTQPISWADYSIGQLTRILSRQGDSLELEQPLRITYDPTLSIAVSRYTPIREVSIECLSFERIDSVSCFCPSINFYHAVECQVRGVEGRKSISAHVLLDASSNISITGCRFHDAFEYNGSSMHGYGIALYYHTGNCRIENNILHHLRHSFSFQCGANGNVVAYNYSFDPNRSEFPANYGADISMHGHYPYANLFEGNIVQNIQLDQTWGPSGPYNTFLRNRAELYGILMSSGTSNSDQQHFVGNEVTSTAFLQGNYTIVGTNHIEYGNVVRGAITPSGTGSLSVQSYYLNAAPSFWNISNAWAGIGPPYSSGSGTIPAKERYLYDAAKTVCNESINTEAPYLTPVNHLELSAYPNPFHDIITVTIPERYRTAVSLELFDGLGRVSKKWNGLSSGTHRLETGALPDGIYLLRISDGQSGEQVRLISK